MPFIILYCTLEFAKFKVFPLLTGLLSLSVQNRLSSKLKKYITIQNWLVKYSKNILLFLGVNGKLDL